MKVSFIANTGIQFYTTEFEVKVDDTFSDDSGNMLIPLSILDDNNFEYPIVFQESFRPQKGTWSLDAAVSFSNGHCVKLSELRKHLYPFPYVTTDVKGVERIVAEDKIDFTELDVIPQADCYSEYNFAGSIMTHLMTGKCPLDCLENKWLPMPVFETDNDEDFQFGPVSWARVKLVPVSAVKNVKRYKVVWAFDTESSYGMTSGTRPYFYEGEHEKRFSLCNKVDRLLDFFSKDLSCGFVDDYIVELVHGNADNCVFVDEDSGKSRHFNYIVYYMTFVAYLHKRGVCPVVTLFSGDNGSKNVDLVLDIGNSKTCGVLFENSDFTKVEMLSLRDLSEPWKYYCKPFDMRLAFHKAKFGEIDTDTFQFEWKSPLRIGDEAIKLIYQSRPSDGVSEKTTNYSSPKRYLWDDKPYASQWEFIGDEEWKDCNRYINVRGVTEQFTREGTFRTVNNDNAMDKCIFSRKSLMTFVILEILQQAKCQINSPEFRNKHGEVDILRTLGKIIITCPTAMPKAEQVSLRRCAEEAFIVLSRCNDIKSYAQPLDEEEWKDKVMVIPSSKTLSSAPKLGMSAKVSHDWGYDEASCCQFVYLYAELTKRYMNHCADFFNTFGHVRKEFIEDGYLQKSITIGSIDMGAGTTDLMICSYKYGSEDVSKLTPVPLFWDSFYYAGDDVLQELVRQLVIEGTGTDNNRKGAVGPIFNAVCSAYMSLSDDDFLDAMNVRNKVLLETTMTDSERTRIKYSIAARETSERIHNFFGHDKALMDFKSRLMRQDFNTQIAVPMGIKFLDLLRNDRKRMVLKYDDFFPELKPSEFILNHFSEHFSLRRGNKEYVKIDFKSIEWVYDPQQVTDIILPKLEPLMSQLAIVLNVYQCDIVLLAGKPMSLRPVTDLFLKLFPIFPNRLIRLNDYRVGEWYPFADGLGYFKDQKTLVAVGAMIGYMAANGGIDGFHIDVSGLKKDIVSTARYIGVYNAVNQTIIDAIISPDSNSATFELHAFPTYLGCKQLPTRYYQARPLYAITLQDGVDPTSLAYPIKITVNRNFTTDCETLKLLAAVDVTNKPVMSKIKLSVQSLADEGTYWLDKGEFVLSING